MTSLAAGRGAWDGAPSDAGGEILAWILTERGKKAWAEPSPREGDEAWAWFFPGTGHR